MTTITTYTQADFPRGAYVTAGDRHMRITRVNDPCTCTVRDTHTRSAFEWLHARYEDWIAWPLADIRAMVRAKP